MSVFSIGGRKLRVEFSSKGNYFFLLASTLYHLLRVREDMVKAEFLRSD